MKLCVALDLPSKQENIKLIQELKDFDDLWVKVGLRSFVRDGGAFLDELKTINPKLHIFLDLKLYDIPNTMLDAVKEIVALKSVSLLTLHASSGGVAMKTIMQYLKGIEHPPLVFAVSILTSFDDEGFSSVYGSGSITQRVEQMAILAKECGIDGMVCAVNESLSIKKATNHQLLTLTPGIRPFGEAHDDQKRISDIQGAKEAQSDFIVIGRPIYAHANPKQKVEEIYQLMR